MRSVTKTALVVFGILTTASIISLLMLRSRGVDQWEAMNRRLNELKLEAKFRQIPRSPLRGRLIPGSAWDEYEAAMDIMVSDAKDENGGIYIRFARGDSTVDAAKVRQLLADRKDAIEHLRQGVQRADGQYPYKWDLGLHAELPSLLASRKLANAAIAEASVLLENGKPQEAADLLLDVTVFARDLSANAPLLSNLIGLAVYSTALDEIQILLQSGKLGPAQLAELDKRLEIVERDFPGIHLAFSNDAFLYAMGLQQMVSAGSGELSSRLKIGDWQLALSPMATIADAFEKSQDYLRRSEKFDQIKFADASREAKAIDAEAEGSTNRLVRTSTQKFSKVLIVHRETLTRLRLVRAALGAMATGKAPEVADPFGNKLQFRQDGRKIRIWSVGSDGTDQNGTGDWESGKPDLVIEIPSPATR